MVSFVFLLVIKTKQRHKEIPSYPYKLFLNEQYEAKKRWEEYEKAGLIKTSLTKSKFILPALPKESQLFLNDIKHKIEILNNSKKTTYQEVYKKILDPNKKEEYLDTIIHACSQGFTISECIHYIDKLSKIYKNNKLYYKEIAILSFALEHNIYDPYKTEFRKRIETSMRKIKNLRID